MSDRLRGVRPVSILRHPRSAQRPRARVLLAALAARFSLSTALVIALHPFLSMSEAQAQVWQGGDAVDPTNFNLAGNWNPATVPSTVPGGGATATFGPGSQSAIVNLNNSIYLGSGGLLFDPGAPAHTINLHNTLWVTNITNNSSEQQTINIGTLVGGGPNWITFLAPGVGTVSGVTINQSGSGIVEFMTGYDASGAAFTVTGTDGAILTRGVGGAIVKLGSVNANNGRISIAEGVGQIIEIGALNRDDVYVGHVTEQSGGTGGLRKVGTGTMTLSLSSLSSYSGPLEVASGTLNATSRYSFGNSVGGTIVSNGATLGLLSNFDVGASETFSLAGNGVGGGGALRNVSGNHTLSGPITLTGDTRINSDAGLLRLNGAIGGAGFNLTFGGAGNITAAGAIGGAGGLAKDGAGTLTLIGDSSAFNGVTTVDGGTLAIALGGKLGGSWGYINSGTVLVGGAGSAWANAGDLYIGDTGAATLAITGGGTVSNSWSLIGSSFLGGPGEVTVSGAGSTWTNTGRLYVSYGHNGTLTVLDGGKVTSADGIIGFGSIGASGTAAVSGAGSRWDVTNALTIGLSVPGTLTIAEGGGVGAGSVVMGLNSDGVGVLNIGAAPGNPAVAAGMLDTASIAFGNGSGTINFNHAGAATFAAALSSAGGGTHRLNHYAGTTTLTGDSSGFAGMTTVSGGMLVVANALGGSITVGSGGLLGGTGIVGSAGTMVMIAAGGVHAPGNSIGVQRIAGDYANHGTLRIEVTPTEADRIEVAGSVDISGATLQLILSPNNAASWSAISGPYIIIDKQSAGAVVGTFSPVTQNLLFFDALVAYDGGDGNDVTLQLARNNLTFAEVGRSPNEIAVGGAVEKLGNANPIWRAIALANNQDIVRAAFNQLSGEVHASARTAMLEDSRFVRSAVNDRIRAAFDGVGAPRMPVMAYAEGGPQYASATTGHLAVWSHGFGSWGHWNGDGNAARLNRSIGGFFIGADAFAFDSWRLGAVMGYSHTSFRANDRYSSGSSNNYTIGLYGGTRWWLSGGDLALRTGVAYTWHDISTSRNVAFPGFGDSLKSDYDAATTQVFGEIAYGVRTGRFAFEPFANLAYVNLHTNSFIEKGGAAALASGSGNVDTSFTTLGLRASTNADLGGNVVTVKGMIGWRHAFGDIVPDATMLFASGSDAFSIGGVPIARDAAVVEAGLDFVLSPSVMLGVSYGGQFGSGISDQSVRASFDVKF